jgi:hypothetical protein
MMNSDKGASETMEEQHGIDQPTSSSTRWATSLFGTVVTLNILIHIVLRWMSYDWLGKSMSVLLLANLTVLLVEVLRKKAKRKMQPDVLLGLFYFCLMLTTSLFNYH